MEQWVGIVIFVGVMVLVVAVVLLLNAKFSKKRAERKPQLIDGMRRAVEKAAPQAKEYAVVMAQAEKDTMSLLKDEAQRAAKQAAVTAVGAMLGVRARLRTDENGPMKFVLAYQDNEIFAVCVGNPAFDNIQPDTDCILHLTRQNVEKIKLGSGGKTTFCMRDGGQFIVSLPMAAASEIEQTAEIKDFKEFVKTFAQVINE